MSKLTWQVLKNNALFWLLGSSPHPSTPDEDDSQTELLIAEEKLSPEDEGQVMPRYENWSRLCCSHKQSKLLIILKRLYFLHNTEGMKNWLKAWRTTCWMSSEISWTAGSPWTTCPEICSVFSQPHVATKRHDSWLCRGWRCGFRTQR